MSSLPTEAYNKQNCAGRLFGFKHPDEREKIKTITLCQKQMQRREDLNQMRWNTRHTTLDSTMRRCVWRYQSEANWTQRGDRAPAPVWTVKQRSQMSRRKTDYCTDPKLKTRSCRSLLLPGVCVFVCVCVCVCVCMCVSQRPIHPPCVRLALSPRMGPFDWTETEKSFPGVFFFFPGMTTYFSAKPHRNQFPPRRTRIPVLCDLLSCLGLCCPQ